MPLSIQQEDLKERLRIAQSNADAKLLESSKANQQRSGEYYNRVAHVPSAPIFIASTEGIGTTRVRANHIDAVIDYFTEQEMLKKNGVPL